MAATAYFQTSPTLTSTYRHEVYKGVRQRFNKVVVLAPPVVTVIVMIIMGIARFSTHVRGGVPESSGVINLGLGPYGTFAYTAGIFAVPVFLFAVVVMFACARLVEQEYRWNTVKMLVTRQPNRAAVVLAKAGAAATLIAAVTLSTIGSWLAFALYCQAYFGIRYGFIADDPANLVAGLRLFVTIGVMTWVYALGVMALTYLCKSSIIAVIIFAVYKAIDAGLSAAGAAIFNNTDWAYPAQWYAPFVPLLKLVTPFLLGTNTNRLFIMRDYSTYTDYFDRSTGSYGSVGVPRIYPNNAVIAGSPIGLGWLMMAVYAALFIGVAFVIFRRRDVNE